VNASLRAVTFWVLAILAVFLLYQFFKTQSTNQVEITYSQFMEKVDGGKISRVTITGGDTGYEIEGEYRDHVDGQQYLRTFALPDDQLLPTLQANNIEVTVRKPKDSPYLLTLISWAPMLLIIGIWIFFMRQMQSGGNKALSFGKSKAKLQSSQGKKITFREVAGVDEAKEELQEVIEFLKEPQKFQKLGGRIPKGVLLLGPPGTGKTLLAKAIAGEANVPFFSISGSDFVEMFVGVGASRVRDLFEQGKKNAPCIVFIDEIDAVGRHRGAGLGGGHDEREQTLNQLLVEMDGFESNEGVILIAATNRPDVLDPALLRPGRFDRRIVVPRPDVRGREEILRVHTRRIPLADNVEIGIIARGSPGFSGADLANLVNEAALGAARVNKKAVAMEDFEGAKDKVLMGTERKSMIISEKEKRTTAFHEAGHAIVAFLHPNSDPLHKVTIIPRGMALGLTQQLPVDDMHTFTKEYLLGRIAVAMGGRLAEEIFLGTRTTGAGNDIEVATDLARKMVCEWGMSENMGPLTFGKKEEAIFLGKELSQHKDYSESTAIMIDREVKRFITDCYEAARKIILENREALERMAAALLEREVLDADEIGKVVRGEELAPMKPPEIPSAPAESTPAESAREKSRPVSEAPGGPLPEPAKG
jgi:cell division protease FtsH